MFITVWRCLKSVRNVMLFEECTSTIIIIVMVWLTWLVGNLPRIGINISLREKKFHVVRNYSESFHQGWGCAYRTLQTLCSWINYNCDWSKSDPPTVPSLLKIQQTLVDIGDKPSTFIQSREWIGSFEICLFLDHCYNVRKVDITVHVIDFLFCAVLNSFPKMKSSIYACHVSDFKQDHSYKEWQ